MTGNQSAAPPAEPAPLAYADPVLRRQQRLDVSCAFLRRTFHSRQLVFAAGLTTTLGSLGYAVGTYTRTLSETPVCTTIGGLLMGLAIPVRRNSGE